ncbi:EAL domain-containing protein [Halioxenophilus sp. WMMB6]|uniref:EAL domain-containing protein n=1 Tax=Halioxenophilus sp. WMMB6 TaxID=3073815 RepID=UPI00295EE533|nr:EAL domain-containing protein [Halioxenophilus sp. WMMB6]
MPVHPTRIYSIYASTGVFLIALLCLGLAANLSLRSENSGYSEDLMQRFQQAAHEPEAKIGQLEQNGDHSCSTANITALRRALFDSQYLLDLGLIQNNQLFCSASVGELAQPVALGPPDFVGPKGSSIWSKPHYMLQLFDDREVAVVLVGGDSVVAVVDPARLDITDPQRVTWELYFDNRGQTFHLAGEPGLVGLVESVSKYYGGMAISCSGEVEYYCLAVKTSLREFVRRNVLVLAFALLLCLLAAAGAGTIVNLALQTRRSDRFRIKQGLRQGKFYWLYQPVVELSSGQIVGCEALARFEDSQGALTPDVFIPLLRSEGLTWQFSEAMFSRVIAELEAQPDLPAGFTVAFNIFPGDLEAGHGAALVANAALQNNRFSIGLEIIENEYIDGQSARDQLQALVDAGYYLSIDDFGTGYSNLKNLKHINFQQLKIDRSFVQDITTEGLKTSMISTIMDIVGKLGVCAVAEGVETEAQKLIVAKAGAHYGQGWHFGRPMSADSLNQRLAKQGQAPRLQPEACIASNPEFE